MASISVPCPKTVLVAAGAGSNAQNPPPKHRISFPRPPNSNQNPSLSFGSTVSGFQWPNRKQQAVVKVQAQLNEAIAKKSSNSALVVDTEPKVASSEGEDEPTESKIPDVSSISAFMTQVSELVKLVDSRDITELQLKQSDCELVIRKKEALQQSAPAAASLAMQPPYPHATFPAPLPAAAPAPAAAIPSPAPAPALPSPAKASSSSHPPLKCPMAGTFYRSSAPGEPPFVKAGDKVQKGQVICIIEAMKLMNEIEADQSGTITEILAEDGKPVSVDTPLFVIVP
ncbi:PREDICTED: biotin carboxyl carrier protein of acetyl-CoA carboxylase, chloroplastic-like [Populus euphratica]|uniref:Biotin carboxyl carrier protein of acetyl-CoA carboxylase n=1 Tax=Populus euphratica TaxID=75702 RepID=A0AAJ6SWX8_POPEU|nr:PREDICTED: biotin carboxyl carrier protein of acetyl-CoA carboxylase, chloroplastic-like [Populus euphratica]